VYRGIINEFQKNYQARFNWVNAEYDDLVAGTHRTFKRRRYHSRDVLNTIDLTTSDRLKCTLPIHL